MMWRSCALLVILSAWQACRARELVNLVWPHIADKAPQSGANNWKVFDHDKSTFETVRRVELDLSDLPWRDRIRPTHYRIIMAAHVPPAKYPRSWEVWGEEGNYYSFRLDDLKGAVFEDGVYEGTLARQLNLQWIQFNFKGREAKPAVAEIELLGPRSALNALWPYGKYPCSQRLAVITSKQGPEKIFQKSRKFVSQKDLRSVFNANANRRVTFYFDDTKPVIIGAKLPALPMVQQVWFDSELFQRSRVRKVVLQGNLCKNDHCNNLGSKGWVKLGEGKGDLPGSKSGPLIAVKNPGEYKVYRLKFIPFLKTNPRYGDADSLTLYGISFLGCTA